MSGPDKNMLAATLFNERAALYQEKYMDVTAYGTGLDLFCSLLEERAQVLDVACGPGNITHYLLQRRADLKILGVDIAPNMIALAMTNNPGARFLVMDARALAGIQERFQGIICAFGLPYLSRPETAALIQDAASLLDPGGIVYLSTMEGAETSSGFVQSSNGDRLYVYYHDAEELQIFLEQAGFTILQLYRQAFGSGITAATDLIIIAQRIYNQ